MEHIVQKQQQSETEIIMKLISQYDINCISLMNEIQTKVGKDVNYAFSDHKEGNINLFSCVCNFNKERVGTGKKNSKQGAKLIAAVEAMRTFLSNEKYSVEKAHLCLAVQKSGRLVVGPNVYFASKQEPQVQKNNIMIRIEPEESIEIINEKNTLFNDSALYELHIISKEFSIEPFWKVTSSVESTGEFIAEVNFDGIVCFGIGKKKLEAKRDAAVKVLFQIRNNKELTDKYYKKPEKEDNIRINNIEEKSKEEISDENIQKMSNNDERRIMFRGLIPKKVVQEIEKECYTRKKEITMAQESFNQYLIELLQKHKITDEIRNLLDEFFYRLVDYTNSLTKKQKTGALGSIKQDFKDYATNCSIIPVGSYALDCMRNNHLTIDAIISYNEVRKMPEKEFLAIYKEFLEDYQNSLGDNLPIEARMMFKLDFSDIGDHLSVALNSPFGVLKIEIQAQSLDKDNEEKLSKSLCHYSIAHIQSVYEYFEDAQTLDKFRSLMSLMRIWRTNSKANLIHPELIDTVLLVEMFNIPNANLAYYINNCLMIMSSEETFQIVVNKFEPFYHQLYQHIPGKLKWNFFTKNCQSLEAIHQKKYKESYFYTQAYSV